LGHIAYHEGVKVDPNKIKSMMVWLIPKTLKNLRRFLGLKGYYRKFVQNYKRIAAPLTTLLNKDSFYFTPEETQDFEQLKEAMCKPHQTSQKPKKLFWNMMPQKFTISWLLHQSIYSTIYRWR